MDQNNRQTALNTLMKIKESLLESMVEELNRHQDDDPSSFSLQEIEDRFAIRIANLNTLIATLQDQGGPYESNPPGGRVVVDIEESNRPKLEARLNEMMEFISPDDFVHLTVVPMGNGKFMIVLAHTE